MSLVQSRSFWHRGGRLALAAFVVLTVLKVWLGADFVPPASAQIPNAGAQRLELVEEARRTNALLTDILATLRTGPLKVEMTGTDNNGATPRPQGGRPK